VARKNANGEGSRPRERADGRREAWYWVDGKRRSVYGSTRKEATDKLSKVLATTDDPQRSCRQKSRLLSSSLSTRMQ
jgi:hypothetical protein